MKIFERLQLINDPQPRGAAMNMAVDEALLEAVGDLPILRVYRWTRPAISFGVFDRFTEVRSAYPERDLVRRWTGGGVVEHGSDFTYSIVAPRDCPWAKERVEESYQVIHLAISQALPGAELAGAATPRMSQACFENPVRHDLLFAGRKVGGAAQRRTRRGLLHQGSIQAAVDVGKLAAIMATEVVMRAMRSAELDRARELITLRYGTIDWMEKV